MASKKQDRHARQRLRDYQARQQLHSAQVSRRKRDNVVWVVVFVVVVALATTAQIFYFNGGPGTPVATAEPEPTASPTPSPSGDVPPASLAENRVWTGAMSINGVPLSIEVDGAAAPQGVSSFVSLVQEGFYDGITCHRLTTTGIFVLQCGDPEGTGMGGPGYSYGPVENAPTDDLYLAGTIAMARQSNNGNSMGSQFFIVYEDSMIPSDSAGGYTVLGRVTSGLDELKAAVTSQGLGSDGVAPAVPTTIESVTVQ